MHRHKHKRFFAQEARREEETENGAHLFPYPSSSALLFASSSPLFLGRRLLLPCRSRGSSLSLQGRCPF